MNSGKTGESKLKPRSVELLREPVELYKVLKFEGLVASGGEAKAAIEAGLVFVNDKVERLRCIGSRSALRSSLPSTVSQPCRVDSKTSSDIENRNRAKSRTSRLTAMARAGSKATPGACIASGKSKSNVVTVMPEKPTAYITVAK